MNVIELEGGADRAHQTFDITLKEKLLSFSINWNTTNEYWSVDIFDGDTNIIYGMALMPNCEISKPYNADIGGSLFFIGEQPTLENLGQSNYLIWVEDDA